MKDEGYEDWVCRVCVCVREGGREGRGKGMMDRENKKKMGKEGKKWNSQRTKEKYRKKVKHTHTHTHTTTHARIRPSCQLCQAGLQGAAGAAELTGKGLRAVSGL